MIARDSDVFMNDSGANSALIRLSHLYLRNSSSGLLFSVSKRQRLKPSDLLDSAAGAKWDLNAGCLADADTMALFNPMPIVESLHLKRLAERKEAQRIITKPCSYDKYSYYQYPCAIQEPSNLQVEVHFKPVVRKKAGSA